MPEEILMPELGESVHEGQVTRWLKQVGDEVKEDEPVVEIMTDKVNQELQAPASGILVKILIPEGELVEVFKPMGLIEPDLELAKKMIAEGGGAAETAAEAPDAAAASSAPAEEAPAASGGRAWFTPVVKAMMKESGVSEAEASRIAGTGSGGRVTKADMEAYLARRGSAPAPAPAAAAPAPTPKPVAQTVAGEDQTLIPLVGMRKMIADAMVRSSQVPVVSTIIEVDVTPAVEFRSINKDSFQQTYGVKLTYTPFFIKALTETLLEMPMLNSALMEDNKIVQNNRVHMGIAVSLGEDGSGGLIVPVIRNCESKSLIDLSRDLEAIAAKARSGKLEAADVQGGTFTLTNPGSYGAMLGTPMINAPQAGILGVYGIQERLVIKKGVMQVRHMMNCVLTYDHRLVDGLLAGRFLQAFKQRMEKFDFFK
jgi:pyruvate/2-oxoglutarate dehydrogenase complex dihydrolipoamide acyltransferase (E2) component